MNNDMNDMNSKAVSQDTPGMIGSLGTPKFSELMFAVAAIGVVMFVVGLLIL